MKEYLVQWEIELKADSPLQAAKLAREIQADRSSLAVVFDVADEKGETVRVDLMEDEG